MKLKSSSTSVELNHISGTTKLMEFMVPRGKNNLEYHVINLFPGMDISLGKIDETNSVIDVTREFLKEFNDKYLSLMQASGYEEKLNNFLYNIDSFLLANNDKKIHGLYRLEEKIKELVKKEHPRYEDKINTCNTIHENLLSLFKILKVNNFENIITPYNYGIIYTIDTKLSSVNTYGNDIEYNGIKWNELSQVEYDNIGHIIHMLDRVGCNIISTKPQKMSDDIIKIVVDCNIFKIYDHLINVFIINDVIDNIDF